MPFIHDADIDPESTLDLNEISSLMAVAVHRTIDAFDGARPVPTLAGTYIVHHLRLFLSTHESMRWLLTHSDQDHLLFGDAVSLAREQVEKLFVMCLLLDDPVKWAAAYRKYAWRKLYEQYLLTAYECKRLTRFADYISNTGPAMIDRLRIEANVLVEEMDATRDRFENELFHNNTPLPTQLKGHVIPEFPTPGKAKDQVNDASVATCLRRWYFVWKELCDYSHVGDDKVVLAALLGRSSKLEPARKQTMIEKQVHEPMMISAIAAASACSEVARLCATSDHELFAAIVSLWTAFEGKSLLGRLLWLQRAKAITPGIILL